MRLIDADALIEDSKTYLNTLNPDNDGKECAKIYWLINVLNESPAVERYPDTISRKAAIEIASGFCHPANIAKELAKLPSAQPQRLTDDDFETIRIHLNAHKEKLCNQHRWEEADEYQRIIDRFMAFTSAQPDIPTVDTPTVVPTCEDTISRQAAIDAVDSETVSTNPEHFKSSEKFIKFMDDADIASFGKWQWANGFNTAVVAAKIQLKNLPSTQPEIIHCGDCKYYTPVTAHCEIRGKGLYLIRGMEDFCSRAERRTDGD